MSWSRVEVVKKKIKVCEYEGMVAVQVRRYGNTMTSSFIGVKLKRGTATPGIDFLHSSANQIQFDQGKIMFLKCLILVSAVVTRLLCHCHARLRSNAVGIKMQKRFSKRYLFKI